MDEQVYDTDRVFTVPNILSFARLAAIPVFTWLIVAGHDVAAVVILAVSGATDWFDGFLARRLKQRTRLGTRLDPITDRLYIFATIIALMVRDIVPWWFVVILVGRDVLLASLFPMLRRWTGRDALKVNLVGKAATFALLLAFPLILLGAPMALDIPWIHLVGWGAAVLGAVLYWSSGALYLREIARFVGDAKRRELERAGS